MKVLCIALGLLWSLVPLIAGAHSGSASYIDIQDDGRDANMTIALDLRDVQYALDLDGNSDGRVTWGELRTREMALGQLMRQGLNVARGGGRCSMSVSGLKVERVSDALYAVLETRASCPVVGALQLHSDLMFDLDVNHRSLIAWRRADAKSVAILSRTSRAWNAPAERESAFAQLRDFMREGVWHIWTGFDHLAFLLVLILPTFVACQRAVSRLEWPRLLAIVSAFTLAHSITLVLAALDVVRCPSRPIEIAIAVSVVFAALPELARSSAAIGVATAFALVYYMALVSHRHCRGSKPRTVR